MWIPRSQLGTVLRKCNRLSAHHKLWFTSTKEEIPPTYSTRREENVSCCYGTIWSSPSYSELMVAGSDVAGLQTTAKKSADGKYYIVNGQKKWITNGIWADYCTAAVRTGGAWSKRNLSINHPSEKSSRSNNHENNKTAESMHQVHSPL